MLDESANIIIVQSHKYSSLYHFKMSHLISFEPDLTQVLIKEGILIKFACSRLEAHVSIKKYQVSGNFWFTTNCDVKIFMIKDVKFVLMSEFFKTLMFKL